MCIRDRALARKDTRNLLLVGAGRQAFYMLAATLLAMPQIENVRILDPLSYDNACSFTDQIVSRLADELKIKVRDGISFSPADDLPGVLSDTDAVITITRATSPIIKKEWVKAGTHFSCIGADLSLIHILQGMVMNLLKPWDIRLLNQGLLLHRFMLKTINSVNYPVYHLKI